MGRVPERLVSLAGALVRGDGSMEESEMRKKQRRTWPAAGGATRPLSFVVVWS